MEHGHREHRIQLGKDIVFLQWRISGMKYNISIGLLSFWKTRAKVLMRDPNNI
jgi:hypothetical protein